MEGGELARVTGLTTRALHHYDDIGLLVPGRTESGHRVYSAADVERLYRVLALRGVGLSLDEIGAVLDDDAAASSASSSSACTTTRSSRRSR